MTDVSARDLVQRIWDQVGAEEVLRHEMEPGLGEYTPLVEDGERRYINSRYVLDHSPLPEVEDGWEFARAKSRLRARAARFVVQVLARYFADEQDFLAHLVRLQNRITVEIDRLSEEVRSVEALLRSESARLRTADAVLHSRLEDRVKRLEEEIAALREAPTGTGK